MQLPLIVQDGTPTHPEHFELSLLDGMLLWLSTPGLDPYNTRRSLAARNAASLKAMGYPIGPICVWDGQHFPARYVCIVEGSILDGYEVHCSHIDPVRKAHFLHSPSQSRCSQKAKQKRFLTDIQLQMQKTSLASFHVPNSYYSKPLCGEDGGDHTADGRFVIDSWEVFLSSLCDLFLTGQVMIFGLACIS